MDSTTDIRNPLLETYGEVVSGFFSPEKKIDDPVFVFPGVESKTQEDELPYKQDLQYFEPGGDQLSAIQQTVENLRRVLESEGKDANQIGSQKRKLDNIADKVRAVRGQAEGIQQLNFHLDAFRKAIQTGDESLLKGNPFYTLTKLIFKHNMTGAVVLLDHLQTELEANAPDQVQTSRPLSSIWSGPGITQNLFAKMVASFTSLFGLSKFFIEFILFFVSSFTSYHAIETLLQIPEITALLDQYFSINQRELLQFMLAALGGGLITTAILDLKAKLFQSIAETGRVFVGIRTAFLINPRWLIVAIALALFSVSANYQSISTLFSKKEYLSEQLAQIHLKVNQTLGSPETANTENPKTLYDLQAMLYAVSSEAAQAFVKIPEEELTGRDPRKGPRYWGKYYIVHGGFEPGVHDVAHSFRNVNFARNMDKKLNNATIAFDLPFSKKLELIADKQAADLNRTTENIRKLLAELDQLMQVGSFSLDTIHTIFSFDHKEVNQRIQAISKTLQANRNMLDTIVQEMDQLSQAYIQIIAAVDRSQPERFSHLRIQNLFKTRQLPSIDTLQSAIIQPNAKQTFAELTAFLGHRYGDLNGKMIMALIVLISFAIDFLAILLFVRKTARQGMADQQIFPELLQYLQDWEDAFIELTKAFFYRPATQQVYRGLTFPNETGVRNAFYKLLEEINSDVKDVKDCSPMEQRWQWMRGLFKHTQTIHIRGYNGRVTAIETLLIQKNIYFPQLVKYLFPGLPYDKKRDKILNEETFLQFYRKTERGQSHDKELFSSELKKVGRGDLIADENMPVASAVEPGFLAKARRQIAGIMQSIKLPFFNKQRSDVDQWTVMIQQAVTSNPQPSAVSHSPSGEETNQSASQTHVWYIIFEKGFLEPFATFPYTRRNWLIDMSSVDEKSLEDLDTLHDFIPDFVKMLKKVLTNTLPVIQESLDPLDDIFARFPVQCEAQGIVVTSDLKERFKEIEKESLGMWGACVSHLLGEEAALNAHFQQSDVNDLAGVLADGGDISQFYERIHTLMSDARAASQHAKMIEENAVTAIDIAVGEVKELCDDVSRMLVKINILSLELRKRRPLPHAKLRGLNEGSALLERAPRESKAILEARDKIVGKDTLYIDENYTVLLDLKSRAQALHSRVDGILHLVDK